MSCCLPFQGIPADCSSSIGGIKRALISCIDSVTEVTISNDEITAITTSPQPSFKEFIFKRQTSNFSTAITVDETAGTLYYQTTIELQFSKLETVKRLEVAALAQSDLVIIIEDANGNYWYFGYDNPVRITDGTADTGTAFGDFNGYTLTFTDYSKEPPYMVDSSIIAGLLTDEA